MNIIKATAPQTQKVHIKHAKIEIEDGIKNFHDALLNIVAKNDNFKWDKKDIQDNIDFLNWAEWRIKGLQGYFNLPE